MTEATSATALVLAAGRGTRMVSDVPKVLHTMCGRSLLGHVLAAVEEAGVGRVVVVVGPDQQGVAAQVAELAPSATVVVQQDQLGTGHAARVALEALPELTGTLLVLPGDAPLLRGQTLRRMLEEQARSQARGLLLTAVVDEPSGYGRVVRDGDSALERIVEDRDADDAIRAIREVATSTYAFDAAALRSVLPLLGTANRAGEQYLTDAIALLRGEGQRIETLAAADPLEILGVNDRVALARVRRIMRDRLVEDWMLRGVTVTDPQTTWLGVGVRLEADVTLHQNTQLHGATRIAAGAVVGPNVTLTDTTVGRQALIRNATCEGAEIGAQATVGPYTYLRPGTRLGRGAKAGGFVEMKSATVGDDSKVPHLSYVGDAVIGQRSNIGAATVFVNYDGQEKHRSVVGNDVRIGSDTMLVAPVHIGDGAYTAAGSVIVRDVPAGALAVARALQRNVTGWVARKRAGSHSAQAAEQSAPESSERPDGGIR